MNFASDNTVGASAPVLQAIVEANAGAMAAYGNDEITRRVRARFAEIFERDVDVFFATTGTAANALALSSAVPPYGLCICHREAHVIDDECGAPEFFMHGAKLTGLPGVGAKLKADDVAAYVKSLPRAVKQMPPKALSISQVSEGGLVYDLDELAALGAVCREHGLAFHMDGARFANALVALGCTPAEMTWKRGVDILSFGATKNGGLMAEAIVVFRTDLAEALDYRSKRAGQIISKARLIAAQFEGYFADDHWLANARHANRMAKALSEGLARLPGVRLAWPTQANEVFPIIPHALDRALKAAGILYNPWTELSLPEGEHVGEGEVLVRLVASWATREEDVHRLLEIASSGVSRHAAE
ncbi:threonine aldolase family protein [Microvirga arsenatis]|uniref:L-threonine aldolase n=1 Tax=Microvirga arsenatis TaxID=2692265 RepID=A0ABW9YZW0_9HYPH|nr:low specificity L-threonine aldolase [Microvirga arsenatis]NBJ12185.1 low specificity L-threonine aldolase [Microvirga arsenatis]NBJ25837.1 low specificity L-threonine aldolase [Microvirga arsenatis]